METAKNVEQIGKMSHEVLNDRALTTQDHLFKLIIIGDTGVGKSCLMKRVMDNEFKVEHQVTIGVEFGSFGVKVDGDKVIKLQIWDTAGQESFKSVTRIFYRGAHCVFLTYDVTREDTFVNLAQWLSEVKQHATEDVRIYMVGNKSEMEEQREVTLERAHDMAKANKIHRVFETSAKTG
jgi:small GTP-binding protein